MSTIAPDVRSEAPLPDDNGMVVRIASPAIASEATLAPQPTLGHGSRSAIGTTAVQLTTTSITTRKGVLVKAGNANTGVIFIGNSNVTAGTADATDGFELDAGESVMIEIDNANKLFARSTMAGQRAFWIAT